MTGSDILATLSPATRAMIRRHGDTWTADEHDTADALARWETDGGAVSTTDPRHMTAEEA